MSVLESRPCDYLVQRTSGPEMAVAWDKYPGEVSWLDRKVEQDSVAIALTHMVGYARRLRRDFR